MAPTPIPALLHVLDSAFAGKAWQGATLTGSIRGISAELAAMRPPGVKHCIWELLLHAAYWKYAAASRLGVLPPHTFERSPSNWPRLPTTINENAWRRDIAYLKQLQVHLRAAVAAIDPSDLLRIPPGGKSVTRLMLVQGAAAHDVYHTGQIQLVKGMLKRWK